MGSSKPPFYIKPAESSQDLEYTKELFRAYASSLPVSLTFQNFAAELASLPGLYSPPTGAIFLAYLTSSQPKSSYFSQPDQPVGVIALRPLPNHPPDAKICEMKRLYLAPASRGLGIGKRLAAEAIQEARKLGYQEMKLDTLPSMVGARKLYSGLGFVECERYYNTPVEGTMFLSLNLMV
jgi:ribosomal protein S18 acetylase RimI-like enzyme